MLARWTPEVERQVLQAISRGIPVITAATIAGIPRRTWDRWQAIADGRVIAYDDGTSVSAQTQTFLARLAEQIATARAQFEATVVERLSVAAEAVNEKTGIPEWRAGAWLLEHHPAYKRDYSEYRELKVDQRSTISHEHRYIRDLPLADVIDIVAEADPEFAALVQPVPDSSQLSPSEHE